METDKFYSLVNKQNGSADLFLYGEIVSGDKWEDSDVTITDFKDKLDALDNNVKTLNMYVNSPGGSVFTTTGMMGLLERAKSRMTINAYVDGIAASAASMLIMKADHIFMYQTSFLMIHKPIVGLLFGANASQLREKADWLDEIEQSTSIPTYMGKAKDNLTEEKLNQMLEEETWLSANEAAAYFNVEVLDEEKDAAACLDSELVKMYKHVPKALQNQQKPFISAEEMAQRQKIAEESKANSALIKTIIGGMIK